jgi:hypothetical protein
MADFEEIDEAGFEPAIEHYEVISPATSKEVFWRLKIEAGWKNIIPLTLAHTSEADAETHGEARERIASKFRFRRVDFREDDSILVTGYDVTGRLDGSEDEDADIVTISMELDPDRSKPARITRTSY